MQSKKRVEVLLFSRPALLKVLKHQINDTKYMLSTSQESNDRKLPFPHIL